VAITWSKANSIRFIEKDSIDPFDGVFIENQSLNHVPYNRYITYLKSDTIKIQAIGLAATDNPKLYYGNVPLTVAEIPSTITTIGIFRYWEFEIDFSLVDKYTRFSATNTPTGQKWLSDIYEVLPSIDKNWYKLQWFNRDNIYYINYSTDIVHMMRVKALFNEYEPGGESTVFDNGGKETKTFETIQRIIKLDIPEIHRSTAEIIKVALAHTNFYISITNSIEEKAFQFISNDNPDVTKIGRTNLVNLSVNLTATNILGVNKIN
jgi:hypothetical protein